MISSSVTAGDAEGARVTFDTFVKSDILDSDSENEQEDVNSNSLLEAELTSYRLTKSEPLSTDPLSYPKINSASFPVLRSKLLNCCVFQQHRCHANVCSTPQGLVDKRRSSLSPEHVKKILCLSSWLNQQAYRL
jgi:hypothetical protein